MFIEVKAKDPKSEKEIACLFDFGDNMLDAATKFGEAAVYDGFVADTKVYIQGVIRDAIRKGKTDAEINDLVATLKPGTARAKTIDVKAALKAKLAGMSDEERAAYIRELLAS